MPLFNTILLEFSHELATFMDLDSLYRIWWPQDDRILELLASMARKKRPFAPWLSVKPENLGFE